MSYWFRQHQAPALAVAFCVGVVLLAGLPVDQLTYLVKLIAPSCAALAVSLIILGVLPCAALDWAAEFAVLARLRVAPRGIPAHCAPFLTAAPSGIASVLLPPPRSIS